jgi:hypothetical protein
LWYLDNLLYICVTWSWRIYDCSIYVLMNRVWQLFNILPGPPVGAPLSVRAPLEHIKGGARTLEDTHKSSHSCRVRSSSPKLTSNTSHSGRRVLRSDGLNHSKPVCATRVHTPLDRAFLDYPQTHPKLGFGGCTLPPGWRNPPTKSVQTTRNFW